MTCVLRGSGPTECLLPGRIPGQTAESWKAAPPLEGLALLPARPPVILPNRGDGVHLSYHREASAPTPR
jgi:hypothetical protein